MLKCARDRQTDRLGCVQGASSFPLPLECKLLITHTEAKLGGQAKLGMKLEIDDFMNHEKLCAGG